MTTTGSSQMSSPLERGDIVKVFRKMANGMIVHVCCVIFVCMCVCVLCVCVCVCVCVCAHTLMHT